MVLTDLTVSVARLQWAVSTGLCVWTEMRRSDLYYANAVPNIHHFINTRPATAFHLFILFLSSRSLYIKWHADSRPLSSFYPISPCSHAHNFTKNRHSLSLVIFKQFNIGFEKNRFHILECEWCLQCVGLLWCCYVRNKGFWMVNHIASVCGC